MHFTMRSKIAKRLRMYETAVISYRIVSELREHYFIPLIEKWNVYKKKKKMRTPNQIQSNHAKMLIAVVPSRYL